MKRTSLFIYILLITNLLFAACSDKVEDVIPDENDNTEYYLTIDNDALSFSRLSSSQKIIIDTNIEEITLDTRDTDKWCTAELNESGELIVKVTTNLGATARKTIFSVKGEELIKNISVAQEGKDALLPSLKEDIKIVVKSGEATSAQGGQGIDKSFDGDYTTIYHSNWSNSGANYFPITLDYFLEEAETLDYILYHPRNSGSNGLFKEFELWIATAEKPVLTKQGDYDFEGRGTVSQISFDTSISKATQVRFVVKSATGDGQGFVSCAEMEFYQKNPDNFDYLTIFSDKTCSQIKAGITRADIEKINNPFYKDLALQILDGQYDFEFRVQEYKPYQQPSVMAAINKTSTYSLRDNPTGISVEQGEELVVFVGDIYNQNISLLIQDLSDGFGGSTYSLFSGMNKFKVEKKGLIYVMYHTNSGVGKPVAIHIATGNVNGYFDSQKHQASDWSRLLAQATDKHFDVLGQYAHLTFPTESFKQYTSDGLALINKLDNLVYLEQDFMGLVKYDKMFRNRMYFMVDYGNTHMYATGNRTGYNINTMSTMCNLSNLEKDPWGPAHEVGHCNQTRPGFNWAGMTEVTNNVHSLYVQTSWGCVSRLIKENRYENALAEIVNAKKAHAASNNVFHKLVPLWQLKLYMEDVLGKKDFYKDLYEYYRVTPNLDTSIATQGVLQLDYVRQTCRLSNLNMLDFFEKWGFLTPVDIELDDYGVKRFTITQEQIDALKAEINKKGYSMPHKDVHLITDNNKGAY